MRARVRRGFTAIDRQETALPSRGRAGPWSGNFPICREQSAGFHFGRLAVFEPTARQQSL